MHMQLLGETPVHARVKPASLKVIVPPPPPVTTPEEGEEAAEGEGEAVNQEGSGTASQPSERTVSTPLVEASAQVEDKPIVAHAPNNAKGDKKDDKKDGKE